MKILRFIQIGDIHYLEHSSTTSIDLKDHSINPSVISAISVPPLITTFRALMSYCQNHASNIGALMLCGDLTSKGDLPAYASCISWLNRGLSSLFSKEHLHAVPGNHDINRASRDPQHADLFTKFRPLLAEWDKINLPILSVQGVRKTRVSQNSCSSTIFSLNSCLGCQELRSLPDEIRQDLHTLLETYISKKGLDAAFSLVGEEIDTPSFCEDDITETAHSIQSLPPEEIPIILAHHNLLPQAKPRIALYTEVLNGGLVRTRLCSCPRPVIYCHGHIHDDPIEVVQPFPSRGKLISISAPEFVKGFNVIDIHFGSGGCPLGCVVKPFRRERHQGVEEQTAIRIPLQDPSKCTDMAPQHLSTLLSALPDGSVRFEPLLKQFRLETQVNSKRQTLIDTLLEVEWFGLVSILNRNDDAKYWQIRKLSP